MAKSKPKPRGGDREAKGYKQGPQSVMWRIERLTPHPAQADLIGNMTDLELQQLAEDIAARGLKHPIRILPDGTIVEGHQRRRACLKLEWSEVPVIVDAQLAEEGAEAVECALIEDNLMRGHYDELTRARLFNRLLELELAKPRARYMRWDIADMRDRVAKRFGHKSGRSMSRLLQVLRTPIEVQGAYRNGRLTLVLACAVERLPDAAQEEIAAALRRGEEPRSVARRYIARKGKRRRADEIFLGFMRVLDREIAKFDTKTIKTISRANVDHVKILKKNQRLLVKLLPVATKLAKKRRGKQLDVEGWLRKHGLLGPLEPPGQNANDEGGSSLGPSIVDSDSPQSAA